MGGENDEHGKDIKAKTQEQQDFVAAVNDTPNGRAMRFGAAKSYNQKLADKKQQEQNEAEILRLSLAYQALFSETIQNLHDARNAVYEARLQAAAELDKAQGHLNQTVANANKTADSEAVFRSIDGHVYDRNNQTVEATVLDGIAWKADAPSWEEYKERLADVEIKQANFDRMVGHEARLDEIQNLMDDEETPPNMEELEALNDEISTIMQDTRREQNVGVEYTAKQPLPNSVPDLIL